LVAVRRSRLGGASERIVLIERALQPARHVTQNVDVGVAHIEQ
jgi:hypothetical protein